MKSLAIGEHKIGEDSAVFIIAEAGVNHNGSMNKAKKLVEIAKASGADAVKFQLFDTDQLILQNVKKAGYQKKGQGTSQSQYEMLKELELTGEQLQELKEYADTLNIYFLATPFDLLSLRVLLDIGVDALKISSTDLTNPLMLKSAAQTQLPILLSTGMSEMSEVEIAVHTITKLNSQLALLQCTSDYPAPMSQVNLRVIEHYKNRFHLAVGYSDHTPSIGVGPYAVAAGACFVEKHFTLDKMLEGPDHSASLDPNELREYVKRVREVEEMMGIPVKRVELCELGNRQSLQKSIVLKKHAIKGEKIQENDLSCMRTGGEGIPSKYISDVIGKRLIANKFKGEVLHISDVESEH